MFMLIEPATAAATAEIVVSRVYNNRKGIVAASRDLITVWKVGTGPESISLQFPTREDPDLDTDADWAAPVFGGVPLALTAVDTSRSFYAPARVRVVKPTTATAVGVMWSE